MIRAFMIYRYSLSRPIGYSSETDQFGLRCVSHYSLNAAVLSNWLRNLWAA